MKPFFSFYGGKWRIALEYPQPDFKTVIEPFAGSAGYSTRYSEKEVILVERDPVIASVWRYLIQARPGDIRSLPAKVMHIDEHDLSAPERALIGFWLNKGASSPRKTLSKWGRIESGKTHFWGKEVRERIASQVDAIKHWRLIEGDYSKAPDIEATWFIDPPYVDKGRYYRFHELDYDALSDWCHVRDGQVMVCENVGASWLPFKPFISAKALEGKNGGKRSYEALWTA